ncbi:MAG: hypothetical protein PHS44_02380 [Candidatus Dojkabacteria bacterium]|jgi:hypothetical protein|nr:hypothetical protein [Candidatus Dojkabacteria bacterium]
MDNKLLIEIFNLHWLKGDSLHDLCLHGNARIVFGKFLVEEVDNKEWSVSTMVLELMRTCFVDFYPKENINFLIPCCGHSMYEDENDPSKVIILGCNNGFSWDIKHKYEQVVHEFKKEKIIMKTRDWFKQVLFLVEIIEKEYAKVKKEPSQDALSGYNAFWREWNYLKKKVKAELLK